MARVFLLLTFCGFAVADDAIDWSKVIEKGGDAVKDLISHGKDGSPELKDIADTISDIGSITGAVCPGPVGALVGAGLGAIGGILGIFAPSQPTTSLKDVLNAVTQGFQQMDIKLEEISLKLDKLMDTLTDYVAELQKQLSDIKVILDKISWEKKFGKELDQIAGQYEAVQTGLQRAVNQSYSGALNHPMELLHEKFDEYDINLQTPFGSQATMDYIEQTMSDHTTGVALYAYERIMTGRVQMFVMMHMRQQFNIMSVTSKEAYSYLLKMTKSYADNFYAEQKAIQTRMQKLIPDGYVDQEGVKQFLLSNEVELIIGGGNELNGRYMLNETMASLEEALKVTPAGFKPGKRILIVTWSDATPQFCLMTGKQQWDPNQHVPPVIPSYTDMITASRMLSWPENSGVRLLNGGAESQDSLQFCTIAGPDHSTHGVGILPFLMAEDCWDWVHTPPGTCCNCDSFDNNVCSDINILKAPCNLVLFRHQKVWLWNSINKQNQYADVWLINFNRQKHFYADGPSDVCENYPHWTQIDDKVFYLTLHTAKLVHPVSASLSVGHTQRLQQPNGTIYV